MKKRYIIIIGAWVLCSFLTFNMFAQANDKSEKTDYTIEEIQLRAPWTISDNVSGLAYYQFQDYASVGGFYNSESGNYRNYNSAENLYNLGVVAQAYKKVNKLLFYGDFTYKYDTKKNQTWLGTYIPDFTTNPILDSIPGKVLSESYDMSGKVAYALTNKTALGIGIDYHTATMAKRTDGRNSNVFSSIYVKPGVTHKSGNFTTGLNLNYKYDVDRVTYDYIGDQTGKNIYYMEGLFFMAKSGITSATILKRAYFLNSLGGALQLDYNNNNLEWFNEFEMNYGKFNNYEGLALTKKYSREELLNYHYGSSIKFLGDNTNHFIKLNLNSNERASYYIINNYEQVPGEIKSWEYYEKGSVLRYMTSTKELDVAYRFCYKKTDWKYNFNITAGFNKMMNEKTYKIFPETYSQNYTINTLYINGRKYFYPRQKNIFELEAGAAFLKGSDDGIPLKSESSGNLGMLQLNRRLLDIDYHYQNVSRTIFNVGARYRHLLNPDKNYALEFCLKYHKIITKNEQERSFLSFSTNYVF